MRQPFMEEIQAERVLDGIWFLTTFLTFGYGDGDERNPLKLENISFVPSSVGDGHGVSQVVVELENGQTWRIEVGRVS